MLSDDLFQSDMSLSYPQIIYIIIITGDGFGPRTYKIYYEYDKIY